MNRNKWKGDVRECTSSLIRKWGVTWSAVQKAKKRSHKNNKGVMERSGRRGFGSEMRRETQNPRDKNGLLKGGAIDSPGNAIRR